MRLDIKRILVAGQFAFPGDFLVLPKIIYIPFPSAIPFFLGESLYPFRERYN